MPATTTQTDLRGLKQTWQDALDEQRSDDDEYVLLHHFGDDGMIDGHIFIGENYGQDTECEVGAHPSQNVPVVLGELSSVLEMIGLPVDGWM